MGRKLYPSESYILNMKHMLVNYRSPPWEWDYEYPEEMYGRFYPEDYICLLQLDILEHQKIKEKNKSK